jgi:hypothetical protein
MKYGKMPLTHNNNNNNNKNKRKKIKQTNLMEPRGDEGSVVVLHVH